MTLIALNNQLQIKRFIVNANSHSINSCNLGKRALAAQVFKATDKKRKYPCTVSTYHYKNSAYQLMGSGDIQAEDIFHHTECVFH